MRNSEADKQAQQRRNQLAFTEAQRVTRTVEPHKTQHQEGLCFIGGVQQMARFESADEKA